MPAVKKKDNRAQKWFRIKPSYYQRVKTLAGKTGRTIGGMLEAMIEEYGKK